MDRLKTVVRKYYSKKLNKTITKTYTYKASKYAKGVRSTKRSEILITKSGKVHKEKLDEFLSGLSFTLQNEAKKYIAKYKGERITTRRLQSLLSGDQREKMLINAGFTLEEGLKELGVTEEQYFNDKNWDGSIFTNPNNKRRFEYRFNYNEDSVWIPLKK